MKIGLLSFSSFTTLVDLILKELLPDLLDKHSVTGIKFNQEGVLSLVEFHSEDLRYANPGGQPYKLQPSSGVVNKEWMKHLQGFDKLILFGTGKSYDIKKTLQQEIDAEILFIPVSIHNDVEGSDITAGYDTVMKCDSRNGV
ncbi:6-phosphofructokinase [Niallia sp. Krafla_26]|uniref:6-phosphofructokinase n=1 Tax=Niallia sp. Krafla_26 TaxID=3064703 RepID=UPI003D16BC38